MKIAFINGSLSWGGLELNQVKNALWMQESGHDVIVFGQLRSRTEEFCIENNLKFIPILPHKKYYDFSAANRLRKLLKKFEIEHVVIRHVNDMSLCALAKYWGNSKFKLHYFMEMQLGVSKRNLLHTLRFSQLDTWNTPLPWLKSQVLNKTRYNPSQVTEIPSAVDTSQFIQDFSKSSARKLLGIDSDALILGIAGRFDPQKGQLLLLKAIKNHLNRPIEVLFLGETTYNEGNAYFDELKDFILREGMSTQIYFRPFRKDIEVFYKAIDAFVMASKAESIGMVTIESMLSGTPVIGSNSGGTRELLQDGKKGFLFEPENPESLGAAIEIFCQNPSKFTELELRESVIHFDKKRVIPQIEKRFTQTTSKKFS